MKFWMRFGAFSTLVLLVCNSMQAQVTATPFSITLEPATWDTWPGLQSFAHGEWNNRWVVMGGRTGGLHDLLPPTPFPVTQANDEIHVFDPVSGDQWSSDVFSLPVAMRDQLRSTNMQYAQRGKYLYIIGGYGKDSLLNAMVTFPELLAVDLEVLSNAVISGGDIATAFRQVTDTLFCVTGGEMEILNDHFYLFGGHVFMGEYSKPAGPTFTQTYTNELRKFDITDDGISIGIENLEQIQDTAVFHRRDLNFEPVVYPDESFGLAAYAGVFQYEADWVWFHPVYITESDYMQDTAFSQLMNAYTCPVMGIYDSLSHDYYATFFGGISQYFYDGTHDTIKEDLNVPFVKDISTVIRHADGTEEQIRQPVQMEYLLGSNAVFIANDSVPHYENGVIQLQHINGTAMAGYIFGGIYADYPNFTTSTASNLLYKVWLQYEKPVGIINKDEQELTLFPNPAGDQIQIRNNTTQIFHQFTVLNNLGETVQQQQTNLFPGDQLTIKTNAFSPGMYFLRMSGEGQIVVMQLVKE